MPDPGVPVNVPVPLAANIGFPRPFGRYTLEKNLSRGGMGEVYLAIPRGVQARCVIKTIRGDLTGDKEFIGRFADEAKIMMRISHENIIRVFDCGRVGTDYYIAMEFVYGRDLGDVLDRAYERGEPLPAGLGLYVTKRLLAGLDYAHNLVDEHGRAMKLVHRDISPQNVLVGFDGSVKLIDFGLARSELLPARTQGALAVGKYGYMSPEQARHEKIDGRADIYSTGVMLFEVFTGDRLVDEQDQATLWARVLNPKHRRPSAVIPELPGEIDDLVMQAVAVKPEDRFGNAAAMLSYVDRMRTKPARREEFVEYLRYLYPKAEFTPPPIPDFRLEQPSMEKSVIIAMSPEGAKSVFGRGELPVEWTSQMSAQEIRADLGRKPGRDGRGRDSMPADGTTPDMPAIPDTDGPGRRAYGSEVQELPTRIAQMDAAMPTGTLTEDATKYDRSPRAVRPAGKIEDDATQAAAQASSGGARKAPSTSFRDEEMTIMMDAPPRNAPWGDVDLGASAAEPAPPAPAPAPAPPSAVAGRRAIQEKQGVRRAPGQAVALRNTVRSEEQPRAERSELDEPRGEPTQAETPRRRPPPAEAPTSASVRAVVRGPGAPNWLLLGLLLLALTAVILLTALLLLR